MPRAQYLTSDSETHTQETKVHTISNEIFPTVIWILDEEVMTVLPGTPVY
jgi:hypothetical protein